MSGNRRGEKIPPEEALVVFEQRDDSARPITATDIIDALGWSRRTVHNKLDVLVERGEIETRKVGARGRVWWIPNKNATDPDITSNQDADSNRYNHDRKATPPKESNQQITETSATANDSSKNRPISATEILEQYRHEIPGRGDDLIERTKAIATAYEYLRDQKTLHIDDIKEYTYSNHPYDENAQRQWVNYLRDGLKLLPGVEPPPTTTSGIWHYVEPGGQLEEMLQMELDDPVEEVEVPPKNNPSRGRKVLVQLAYDYLKDHKRAYKDDFERELPDEYMGHYQDFETGLWERCLRDALPDLPGVISPPIRAGGLWTYIEPGSELDERLDVDIDSWVKKIDVKGEGRIADIQRSLIQIAYDYLKVEREATKSDFEKALPNYSAHYSNFEGFWSYCLRDALKAAKDVESSKSDRNRATVFRYVDNT